MIRRISTKLVLAVLAAVVVPFVGFALFVEYQMGERLSRDVVLFSLKGLAAELAAQIDRDIDEFRLDLAVLAKGPWCNWALIEAENDRAGIEEGHAMRSVLAAGTFDASVALKRHFELLMIVDTRGRMVACNQEDQDGQPFAPQTLIDLEQRDFTSQAWFQAGMEGRVHQLDQHESDLLPRGPTRRWFLGFSAPVFDLTEPGVTKGVLFGLVDWEHVQDSVRTTALTEYFRGLVGPERFPSAYGWVWKSDANTILAHPRVELYGQRIREDLGLGALTEAALAGDWGLYPEYVYGGKKKSAAFKHTRRAEQGGFDWIVGVGIDNDDIFRGVDELRATLVRATAIVLLIATLWILVIARRITEPILALREHTRRVAAGDLDARVVVRGGDELGELGQAFNEMTREIKEQRAALVKAEKDAAWREMARQVAHDIKNPLTPIQLSVDLLRRAKQERSDQFEPIFERTTDTISRQVEHLREIANDFQALTGALKQKNPRRVDVGALLDDLIALNEAWARESKVEMGRHGGAGFVFVDASLLRRVLQNLISNAIQASPDGGELRLEVATSGHAVRVTIADRGVGLTDEARTRLFEPYFTTRSTGTGLGLAIARRAVLEMGGTISLSARDDGPGSVACVELPADDGKRA